MSATLDSTIVLAAARELSAASGFWFTRRILMFELCRREAWPDPGSDLDACETEFATALAALERAHGRLERLIRPEELAPIQVSPASLPPDVLDYSVARVALFERLDLCLMVIANGMHRTIEVAPTVPPAFPAHVWPRIQAQIDAGLRTTFLAIHDLSPASQSWVQDLDAQLRTRGEVELVRAGLTMPRLQPLGLPLRTDGQGAGYALLEELTPLRALRTIYRRVCRGAEDIGFG